MNVKFLEILIFYVLLYKNYSIVCEDCLRPSTSLQSIYTFKCVTSAFAITFHTPAIHLQHFQLCHISFCNYLPHTCNSPTLSNVPTTRFINYFINYLYMHSNYVLVNNIFYFNSMLIKTINYNFM